MHQFGPFTFDAVSGDLTREGRTQRLTPQTAQVLAMLLEAKGSVVTRAELQARIWPDTTVDFDQGLNFCVRQLRIALDDDAAQPTYIETLPKRGYRLLVAGANDGQPSPVGRQPFTASRHRGRIVAGAVVLTAIFMTWRATSVSEPSPVILAIVPFDADSGLAPLIDYRNRLAEELVDRLTIATRDSVAVLGPASTSAWNALSRPDSVRAQTNADYVLSGIIRRRGTHVDVFAQFIRTSDGAHIWVARPVDSAFASTGRTQDGARIADSVAIMLLSGDAARRPAKPNNPR